MAFISCNFRSKALGMNTQINVIIPEKLRDVKRDDGFPVLYLLHGLSDDNSAWCRNTSIERYAEDKGLVVVMPWGG
ncbi:MAG TPA: alpha/beta hydrolase-fold protein, partial [Ruminiclostridium sp.]